MPMSNVSVSDVFEKPSSLFYFNKEEVSVNVLHMYPCAC